MVKDKKPADFKVVKAEKPKKAKKVTKTKNGKTVGRPKKHHKYDMQNGIIDAKRIFLYVPVETIDPKEIDRFLELCDRLLNELGPKAVTEIDIKDVATLFRDTLVRDKIYIGMRECAMAPDKSLILDLKKISEQIDTLQKSLKIRAADRDKERTNNKDLTMIEIIDKFKEDENLFALFDIQQKNTLDKYYSNPHTEVDEYMSIRAPQAVLKDNVEEGKTAFDGSDKV